MEYTITKAKVEDIERLNELINSAYRGETSKKGWTTEADLLDGTRITPEILEDAMGKTNTTLLVYIESDKIFGCVELRNEGDRMYLGLLTVDPNSQAKGIGKKLLNEAEKLAHREKINSIYMSVISTRTELIDWYKRNGYNQTGTRKPFQMPDERWGIPKQKLEFLYLEKNLSQLR